MGTEVDHASGDIQTNITAPSSATTTSGPKTSMFAKKSGFVIPKNKLSGSLVPIYRGSKKGDTDLKKEEASTNQVVRKTKWGPDLTLDTSVRKGRALAYQTRINQISQQLTLGTLEAESNQDFLSTSEHQLTKELESELMEIEKREIIGEVLKLNPTYKAPADYKPLLKEAKVPIPIKEYPGYNFIGLVYGPANDTQKRIEKETGAKIQVYGKKSDTGEKIELVTPTDGKEVDNTYEDLYVHVSADTFEKIDEAVALIELLLTHVSVNSVSSSTIQTPVSNTNVDIHHSTSSSIIAPPPTNQVTTQPHPGPLPPHRGQLPQYPQAWFHANPNHTAPLLSNTVQASSSPFNPTAYGPRPNIAANLSPVLQNHSVFPPRPQNVMQPLYMQQAPSLLGQASGPRNTPGPFLSGSPYNARPMIPTSLPATLPNGPSCPPPMNIPNSNNMIAPSFGRPSQSESARPTIQPSPTGPSRPTIFGGSHNFDSAGPLPASVFRPQQPSSGDFTFQPQHRPWQSNQPTNHNSRLPIQPGPGPHPPMLRPMMGNVNPSSIQTFPRLQMNHPTNFSGNLTVPVPSRHMMLPTGQHVPQPRNPQHMNNPSGPFHQRPHPQMHIPENHLHPQQRFLSPRQHFGNHHHYPGRPFSSSSGPPQQVYDPFSPSSVPFHPQMGGKGRVLSENDPEYDDLMASVGVQ